MQILQKKKKGFKYVSYQRYQKNFDNKIQYLMLDWKGKKMVKRTLGVNYQNWNMNIKVLY